MVAGAISEQGEAGPQPPGLIPARVSVSVVVPARDAAETLPETLDSLFRQTRPDWEAIVVDDGSSDRTAELAASVAEREPRIRPIRQLPLGVSAARNLGVAHATSSWILFLDADDLLERDALERMLERAEREPTLAAVCGGWARVAPDGTVIEAAGPPPEGDLFEILAQRTLFPVHACLIRRSVLDAAGGWDDQLVTCEDWDFWQRVARTGARFGTVPARVALHRTRAAIPASRAFRLLEDGLTVLRRGHAPDPRVRAPAAEHAQGRGTESLGASLYHFPCWCAGLLIGAGEDARPVFAPLDGHRDPGLDPAAAADFLLRGARAAAPDLAAAPEAMWEKLETRLDPFLDELERQSGAAGMARRARNALERKFLEAFPERRPLGAGATHAVRIEITSPIPNVFAFDHAERLICDVTVEGALLGRVELPLVGGRAPAAVIADAIADAFAWTLLARFFGGGVYREVYVGRAEDGLAFRRGDVSLAPARTEDGSAPADRIIHERVFWPVFLQELWGRSAWTRAQFHDPQTKETPVHVRKLESSTLRLEVADDLPDVYMRGAMLRVIPTVGGSPAGVVQIPVPEGVLRAQQIRAAITSAIGFELCRLAVREGLLGRSFSAQPRLRERLFERAGTSWWARPQSEPPPDENAEATLLGGVLPDLVGEALLSAREAEQSGVGVLVLGLRTRQPIGSSASRRAVLPGAAAAALLDAAAAADEAAIVLPPDASVIGSAVYAPDVVGGGPVAVGRKPSSRADAGGNGAVPPRYFHRHHFEATFAGGRDPWRYTSEYELRKYERTLEVLGDRRPTRALELGCAEGHFTLKLADRAAVVVAADISEVALERARARCAQAGNVKFGRLDVAEDPLPGYFDLIVASELLYYVGDEKALRDTVAKLVDALEPGGLLLSAHANVAADTAERPAFEWDVPFGAATISRVLAETPRIKLVEEMRTPLYRIELHRRESPLHALIRKPARRTRIQEAEPLPHAAAAAAIRWPDAQPEPGRRFRFTDWMRPAQAKQAIPAAPPKPVFTERLPILAYHRVAEDGPASLARYRVSPDQLEAQLRYLKDARFRSVTLEEWRLAMERQEPLPGRAVLITFDDGYQDFDDIAWPLLRASGFGAMVFLVGDAIGGRATWDREHGHEAALMGWRQIGALREQGVAFGSHSATHRPPDALLPADIVREASRSRATLTRGLGEPVTAFAYPYGGHDAVVAHLTGATGYVCGLTVAPALSSLGDAPLLMPRVEIHGTDDLPAFIRKLSGAFGPDAAR